MAGLGFQESLACSIVKSSYRGRPCQPKVSRDTSETKQPAKCSLPASMSNFNLLGSWSAQGHDKIPRVGDLNKNRHLFFHNLKLEVQAQGASRIGFW
jgi:hypothetical protein